VGQEINTVAFKVWHFNRFKCRLKQETDLLGQWAQDGRLSMRGPMAGFELEACLIDQEFAPAFVNARFMQVMDDPRVAPELARFNIEFNSQACPLTARGLSEMHRELEAIWTRGMAAASACEAKLLSIGILPTLGPQHLTADGLTPWNRYRVLNEQVMRAREGRNLRLNVNGREHLRLEHDNMMLEAAGTSFQIHLQAPITRVHRLYNAALAVSAPVLAAGANSPYLFGVDLWDESRMALFEQSLEVGGYGGAAQGPLRRVSLGLGYVRESIMECFEENLQHFPVLLPMLFDDPPERLSHLRLHNGTIWRWNRPLIGFDTDGTPHVRIEHRVLPGSPSTVDAISDAAFFYGLITGLCEEEIGLETRLPFAQAKQNFYQAARHGLSARMIWLNEKRTSVRTLLLDELLPLARHGLLGLALAPADCERYLGIIEQRVASGQNGATWQREFVKRHGRDLRGLTAAYAEHQQTLAPVHTWPL
jgi:hypothetical protein